MSAARRRFAAGALQKRRLALYLKGHTDIANSTGKSLRTLTTLRKITEFRSVFRVTADQGPDA